MTKSMANPIKSGDQISPRLTGDNSEPAKEGSCFHDAGCNCVYRSFYNDVDYLSGDTINV